MQIGSRNCQILIQANVRAKVEIFRQKKGMTGITLSGERDALNWDLGSPSAADSIVWINYIMLIYYLLSFTETYVLLMLIQSYQEFEVILATYDFSGM